LDDPTPSRTITAAPTAGQTLYYKIHKYTRQIED
jgi:hypothetical protein